MNLRLVSRMLGVVAWLIGLTMAFSLPIAWPQVGGQSAFEARGFWALLSSIAVCGAVGLLLRHWGKNAPETLYRKEAMAVVGLSWVLATVLGAVPYYLGGVNYRAVNGIPLSMGIAECLFESQSGFSTTGATVISDLENTTWVPRCILFWRSSTHFLGGLGIIVLFVAILGQGSAGKALMRAEMPGPSKEGSMERMQHTAWVFVAIYCGLNLVLTILLYLEGMPLFEALCHSFGAIASGGFSTLNASIGGFEKLLPNSYRAIEYTIIVFMILAGTNFTLLYLCAVRRPGRLFADPEWRTYASFLLVSTILIMAIGIGISPDFDPQGELSRMEEGKTAFRLSAFQAVSLMSTTGYVTADYDRWNNSSRAILMFLALIGGCAGSTSGGLKVIRILLLTKIMGREIEHSYHPSVVRHVRLAGEAINDPDLIRNILGYICLALVTLILFWLLLVCLEPDSTWIEAGHPASNKLIDLASSVVVLMHNVGPGLGVVGATGNYAEFTAASKLLLTVLMMLGRIEIFAILVLVIPSFWRTR